MTSQKATYLIEKGIQLEIVHQGKKVLLKEGVPVTCKNRPLKD